MDKMPRILSQIFFVAIGFKFGYNSNQQGIRNVLEKRYSYEERELTMPQYNLGTGEYKKEEQVEVTLAGWGGNLMEQKLLKQTLDEFEKTYPNIEHLVDGTVFYGHLFSCAARHSRFIV